jgi:hypothetical protein
MKLSDFLVFSSNCFYFCFVSQKEGEIAGTNDGSFIHAKLHLVDLAGSERAKRTGASGTRFKESVGINQVSSSSSENQFNARLTQFFLKIGFIIIGKGYSSIDFQSNRSCSLS